MSSALQSPAIPTEPEITAEMTVDAPTATDLITKDFEDQINHLSTKLMDSFEIQSNLELKIKSLIQENKLLKTKVADANQSILDKDREIDDLSSEMEELSATLFDEANEKVKTVNIELNNYKIKNSKLYDELNEKETIINLLKDELKDLKVLIDDTNDNNINNNNNSKTETSSITNSPLLNNYNSSFASPNDNSEIATIFKKYNYNLIYSPIYNNLRTDTLHFTQYSSLIHDLKINPSYSTIKDSKYYKHLLLDDIDITLRLDLAPGLGFFKSKKSLLNHLLEGRCSIEPISGVTEIWKKANTLGNGPTSVSNNDDDNITTSATDNLYSYPKNSPPVATHFNCAFCGESRNDKIEHARLYKLKLFKASTITTGTQTTDSLASTDDENITTYHLCSSCLLKLRATCDLFAVLRNLLLSMNEKSDRHTIYYNLSTQEGVYKSYFDLTLARSKMFWSRVGIWEFFNTSTSNNNNGVDKLPDLSLLLNKQLEQSAATTSLSQQQQQPAPPLNSSHSKSWLPGSFISSKSNSNRSSIVSIAGGASAEKEPAGTGPESSSSQGTTTTLDTTTPLSKTKSPEQDRSSDEVYVTADVLDGFDDSIEVTQTEEEKITETNDAPAPVPALEAETEIETEKEEITKKDELSDSDTSGSFHDASQID